MELKFEGFVITARQRNAGEKKGPHVVVEVDGEKIGTVSIEKKPEILTGVKLKKHPSAKKLLKFIGDNYFTFVDVWRGAAPVVEPNRRVTYVAFVRDHSASMSGLRDGAIEDYNAQVRSVNQQENVRGVSCYFSEDTIKIDQIVASKFSEINSYQTSGMTPLYDAVGAAITELKRMADRDRDVQDAAFLVMVTTDGEENSSKKWSRSSLASTIRDLTATDLWTFAFRVPKGHMARVVNDLKLPPGNVLEWETTRAGLVSATAAATSGFNTYFQARSAGLKSSRSFYTDASNVTTRDLKENLADVTRQVELHTVPLSGPIDVSKFSTDVLGRPLQKGSIFYQLMKREDKVQDYKVICIRDKRTGKVYGGDEARDMIGLPRNGTHPVIPGNHGQFDIFVQSTSLNRKLPAGSKILFWESAPGSR